ncbi:Biotin carboxyl carrier protein of acetyl-CoA carboxylase [Caenispirillum salinarum AK4]|uniref:Biotin carboxyl carrier protein of acetyl-CoA carboxylase n=1 Tax=Caenispirillum salinarum AK4 TaxID=1238182 RepID=K9HP66_9PROT|nr:acetyl-CoA carboxylase biotin carboxyl carrier protein [Caenispirillum salinarum]EKV32078.1 Biotin carboxyl carrier protein of acetyl-CoA carboxylase [Caenispirillum salinarum AK4]
MTSKPTIDSAAVRDLATLLDETGLSEIEYETENVRIRVARGGISGQTIMAAPQAHAGAAPAPAPAAAAMPAPAPATAEDAAKHPGAVTSPMVGVLYNAPEPGAAPFITEGAKVSEGQTLFLIEAMKTFNPVRAPKGGTVTKILADDAQAVEFGEPLCIIE